MAGDFKDLLLAMGSLPGIIEKGCEEGLRKSGNIIVGTAKKKLGEYQPTVGEYSAWAPLKPESIRRKFLSKKKKFHITESGKIRINLTRAGKQHLAKYGRNAKVFGGGKQFQASGTSDDSPLIDTGRLRSAITMDDSDATKGMVYIGVAGKGGKDSPADYAAAHEFGSAKKNIPPRPYLRPSIYENKEEIEETIKSSVIEAMTGFR